MTEENYVLIKIDYRYESISSKAGIFSKLVPSMAPKREDLETFDYFGTTEEANAEAVKRRNEGLPFMENLVVTGRDMMKGKYNKEKIVNDRKKKSNTKKGITTGNSIKPGRQEQRDNAKQLDENGQVSDPNYNPDLDLNKDGVNDEKDASIAGKVLALSKKKYNYLKVRAKELGVKFVAVKKAVLAENIAKAEAALEAKKVEESN